MDRSDDRDFSVMRRRKHRRLFVRALFTALVLGGFAAYWSGSIPAVVPDVRGLSEEVAVGRLQESGFTRVKRHPVDQSSAPPGTVVSQSPAPDAITLRRTFIDLGLSTEDIYP